MLDYNLAYNLVLQQYFEPGFQRWGFLKDEEIYNYADKLIEDFDIRSGEGADTITRSMSGGNQQKVVMAKILAMEPEIFLMHDITRGVDVGTKKEMFTMVRNFAKEGHPVIFFSTDVEELVKVCDRVLVMYDGKNRSGSERSVPDKGEHCRGVYRKYS